ncbi:hypothetical protein ACDF64_04985 [Agromyces sp. MMS24-JH15]|uniref:hypothetical protein n=1 Tax=Agromyces sp. MMS24-JH15 TaxID=3243765 RepID=UPI003749121F
MSIKEPGVISAGACIWVSLFVGAASFFISFQIQMAVFGDVPVTPATAWLVATPFLAFAVGLIAALVVMFRYRSGQRAKIQRAKRDAERAQARAVATEERRIHEARAQAAPPGATFDPTAARRTLVQNETDQARAYEAALDEIDSLIQRSLDLIAARGYADSGSVMYPAGDFGTMREDWAGRHHNLHAAWLIHAYDDPAGDGSPTATCYYLDDAGNLTTARISPKQVTEAFERRVVTPMYQRSTRQFQGYRLAPYLLEPNRVIRIFARFIANGGRP